MFLKANGITYLPGKRLWAVSLRIHELRRLLLDVVHVPER
jgi:hypothetical protein